MNICVAANKKYIKYLYVMLTSLLKNNDEEDVFVYILQNDFELSEKQLFEKLFYRWHQLVSFIDIDDKVFRKLPTTEKFPVTAFFRLMMPYVLPENVEKVIYLDADLIVQYSLRDLYETKLGDAFIAACRDGVIYQLDEYRQNLFQRYDKLSYFNSGVMLWDLKKFRQYYRIQDFILVAERLNYDLQYADQEILNYMFYDKMLYLSAKKYNYMTNSSLLDDSFCAKATIVHFSGLKPWELGPKTEIFKDWWKYARMTPFYVELLEAQVWKLEDDFHQKFVNDNIITLGKSYALKRKLEKFFLNHTEMFCIYGAGRRAEMLLGNLSSDIIKKKIVAIVDQKKMGYFFGVPIYRSVHKISEINFKYVIITPKQSYDEIFSCIKLEVDQNIFVINLDEFLKII